MLMVRRLPTQLRKMQLRGTPVLLMVTILLIPIIRQHLRSPRFLITRQTPKEPQVPNNGNKVTPKDFTQGKMYDKTSRLPQTGDGSSMGMMLIGLVTLLLSLGLVVISRFTI